MTNRRTARTRDRAATEQLILDAAAELLGSAGFTALGVNALAERAGVDKQLIYRYFGSLDGVVAALGTRIDLWLGDPEPSESEPATSYADLISRLLDAYIVHLRGSKLLQRLIAWELVQPSPTLAALESARSAAMTAWLARAKGTLVTPADTDAAAINALLLAGVHHLVLREASAGRFAGLDLNADSSWDRIRAAARHLVALAYPSPAAVRRGRNRTGGSGRPSQDRKTP